MGDRRGRARRRGVRTAGEQPAETPGDGGDADRRGTGLEEPPAVVAADRRRGRPGIRGRRSRKSGDVPEPSERHDAGHGTHDRRDRVGEVVRRSRDGGGRADRPQDHGPDDAEARPPHRGGAQDGDDDREHDPDPDQEDDLVLFAERPDRERLQPLRARVDRRPSHGDDRGGAGSEQGGEQLRRPERDHGREHPDRRAHRSPGSGRRGPRLLLAHVDRCPHGGGRYDSR